MFLQVLREVKTNLLFVFMHILYVTKLYTIFLEKSMIKRSLNILYLELKDPFYN